MDIFKLTIQWDEWYWRFTHYFRAFTVIFLLFPCIHSVCLFPFRKVIYGIYIRPDVVVVLFILALLRFVCFMTDRTKKNLPLPDITVSTIKDLY